MNTNNPQEKSVPAYIFLKEKWAEGARPILVVSSEIETLNIADTYNQYGAKVGHTDAGDYSIKNISYSDAYWDMLAAVRSKYNIDETIEFDIDVEDLVATEEIGVGAAELKDFCEEWCKENETFNTIEGFNYWDGRNWQTVTTFCEFNEPSHEVIEVPGLTEELDNISFIESKGGRDFYESENYWIVESHHQGYFEKYSVYPKSEFEYEDCVQ